MNMHCHSTTIWNFSKQIFSFVSSMAACTTLANCFSRSLSANTDLYLLKNCTLKSIIWPSKTAAPPFSESNSRKQAPMWRTMSLKVASMRSKRNSRKPSLVLS